MKIFLTLIFNLILVVIDQAAQAQDEFSQIQYKVTTLSSSLYMLEGAGGNITASIGPDGVLLVDDDFAEMSHKLVAKLKELKGDRPRYIINTHFHYDHAGANTIFGPMATIIAAPSVRRRLATEQTLWKKQHPALPAHAFPRIMVDNSLSLHLNKEDVRVVHFPNGHTDGDVVVFFPQSKVVSVGDLYFAGMFPIFHPEHRGSLKGYVASLEAVLKQIPDDVKIVPGHGPLSRKSDFQTYHRMILSSLATVQAGIRSGLSLEQIQQKGLPQEWGSFRNGYASTPRWLEMIYKELSTQSFNPVLN